MKIDLQNAQLEMKNQKKILEMEIGSDFVNSSQLLGNGFKGRNQQIIALQSRVKELERIKGWLQNSITGFGIRSQRQTITILTCHFV